MSIEKRGDLRQHFIHDRCWQGVHLAGMAGGQVEQARLIAPHDAGGLDACHLYGEAQAGGSSRNGKNRTLRLGRGWNPPAERWDGHAEVQGYVSRRHIVG
jgi:hypothetical protein